jgi:hypothetical protein
MSAAAQTCGGHIQAGLREDPAASDRESCLEGSIANTQVVAVLVANRNVVALDVKRGLLNGSERADMEGDLAIPPCFAAVLTRTARTPVTVAGQRGNDRGRADALGFAPPGPRLP